MEWTESGRTTTGVAFELTAGDSGSPSGSPKVPRRIRRRLTETRVGPSSAEEIDARLRDADLRRQQFHAWLSSKARPKARSPSWSSQEEDPGQRLEAKLLAAEQKRLSLLMKAQKRLAQLDELRQAAKSSVELRLEKEREMLGTRVESRVLQAEENRMLLLKANAQRRVAAHERTTRLLLQRVNREAKYKERVRMTISQKRAAAEKKRLGMLEAEKTKARAQFMQACRVAKLVCHQRETERRKMKEQLDNRLQRARWQRAEYLKQRGILHSSCRINYKNMHKQGEILSKRLTRCWRQFVRSKCTTLALVKEYEALNINAKSVHSMPFEQLAGRIQSSETLKIVKSLLDRLESRLALSQLISSLQPENIDQLLKRVASPIKSGSSSKIAKARRAMRKDQKEMKCLEPRKMPRYSARVVLCAYMILGQPDAVFSGRGNCENELTDSAVKFIHELELLIKIISDGPQEMLNGQELSTLSPIKRTFRSQLAVFDAAWCSYLYTFVVWKGKDAKLLEEDLVRAACQLELSMMQKCKLTSDGQFPDLTHDMRAIRKQVMEDQKLLREKVKHLSGVVGIERMESALSDTRSKFFDAKESRNLFMSSIARNSSPSLSTSSSNSSGSSERSKSLARSLFVNHDQDISVNIDQGSSPLNGLLSFENEHLVNEILHDAHGSLTENTGIDAEDENNFKVKVKRTMEKAFWDGIVESLTKDHPNYGRLIGLVKEVRDELCEIAPRVLKQEIKECIDIDILTQLLDTGSLDFDYLRSVLEYSLATLLKMSAPAKEAEMKKAHQNLLVELAEVALSNGTSDSSIAAVIRGLRFVLEEVKVLRKEISMARILMFVPIIKSPAGVEYLQKTFNNRFGPPCNAASKLPLTKQWLSSFSNIISEWREHNELISTLAVNPRLPVATGLRSGGSMSPSSPSSMVASFPSYTGIDECRGEQLDVFLRIGLLKLVSRAEGLIEETLPETMKLNFSRLRNVQENLQKIIVTSTSMLVLRQILLSEKIATSADIESKVAGCVESLFGLFEQVPDVGTIGIIDTIVSSYKDETLKERKEIMARVLVRSLQAGDVVFKKVTNSLYLACRAVVFTGSTVCGRELADVELRRVGASMLLDKVMDVAEKLALMAKISGQVHRLWYESILRN